MKHWQLLPPAGPSNHCRLQSYIQVCFQYRLRVVCRDAESGVRLNSRPVFLPVWSAALDPLFSLMCQRRRWFCFSVVLIWKCCCEVWRHRSDVFHGIVSNVRMEMIKNLLYLACSGSPRCHQLWEQMFSLYMWIWFAWMELNRAHSSVCEASFYDIYKSENQGCQT